MDAHAVWRGTPRYLAFTCALTVGLSLSLAACDSTTSVKTTAKATTTALVTTPTTSAAGPTATPLPGSGNLVGATDICTAAVSVSTQLPADIPPYNAQLRLAQSNNGNSEFGYCASASVDTIASFYAAQLPGKGWQNIQTFHNNATRNIIATRGSENLTITVSPDVLQQGNADLLIIVQGE